MTPLTEEVELDIHQKNVFRTLNEYRVQNLFCDVTLDINGTLFPCHRLILIASSPYFRAMFNGNFIESTSDIIPIQEVDAEAMDIILSAIYTCRIRLYAENLYFILKASHLLQVNMVFNACVTCIMNNATHIHYLIETCLFAETMGLEDLYDKCTQGIAADFVHWGKTNKFLILPFNIVKHIFSHVNPTSNNDDIFWIIIKWCRYNPINLSNIKILLQASKFSGKPNENSIIGQLVCASMFSAIKDLIGDDNHNEDLENEAQSTYDLNFNVYLNAVNVKTGASGWGTLKLSESFDNHTLSNFRTADHSIRKICLVGTKVYCLEWNFLARKFNFSYFENDRRIELPVPKELILLDGNGLPWCHTHFEMIAVEKVIYLFYHHIDSEVWVYDCQLNTWQNNIFKPNIDLDLFRPALIYHGNWFTLASLDRVLYVVGCKRYDSMRSDHRYILTMDTRTPIVRNYITFPTPFQHENAAVCTFDGKIAISGSDHGGTLRNTFSIFDVRANKWRTDVMRMNEGRAKHKLLYHRGFIYAVEIENRPFIKNEKYDVKSNTWIDIPNLPERAQFVDADDDNITISFTKLLCADIVSAI